MENLSAKSKTLEKREKAFMMFEKLPKLYTEMVLKWLREGLQTPTSCKVVKITFMART